MTDNRKSISYLCAPYRGQVHENIVQARLYAGTLWRLGDVVLCPHTNTGFFDSWFPDVPDDVWLQGCLTLLERCDRLVLPPLDITEGMEAEITLANNKNIPVVNFFARVYQLKELNQGAIPEATPSGSVLYVHEETE